LHLDGVILPQCFAARFRPHWLYQRPKRIEFLHTQLDWFFKIEKNVLVVFRLVKNVVFRGSIRHIGGVVGAAMTAGDFDVDDQSRRPRTRLKYVLWLFKSQFSTRAKQISEVNRDQFVRWDRDAGDLEKSRSENTTQNCPFQRRITPPQHKILKIFPLVVDVSFLYPALLVMHDDTVLESNSVIDKKRAIRARRARTSVRLE
jgi:hypothetical protein